ncbi:hypothetical protein K435DRAFT_851047 [Dendrothele bispora CBS 962.96]|uniref:Uncharacterized protein n=1 Tax=Dendrothele bispora (strain CBS 962.96) TaxID=1314807 RepID=A0A4S8MMU9_DENBC|nr:hypothetical protein K435DRAFT_851047 [Dendrothele bispora CBS 962.96]
MPGQAHSVNVTVVEESLDIDIRFGHAEFADFYAYNLVFQSTSLDEFDVSLTRLGTGDIDLLLISRSLFGSLPLDGIVLDTVSRITKSVNMITYNDGVWHGINTDHVGIHFALTSSVPDPHYREVLLVGDGPLVITSAYVLIKHFGARCFYLENTCTASFQTMSDFIHSVDVTCQVVGVSTDRHLILEGSISCIVTDVDTEEQDDLQDDRRKLISDTLDSIVRERYGSHRGVFLNLGRPSSSEGKAGWSALLDGPFDWSVVELPTLRLATVPAVWEVLGCEDMAVFARVTPSEGSWIVDETVVEH